MHLKPREKLVNLGPEQLEDHELLALILSKGSSKENVFDLARRLLKTFDREELIAQKDFLSLQQSLKTGFVQTCQIMASIELGKRLFHSPGLKRYIQSVDDAYEIVKSMQYLQKEYVRGLYLNTRYRIIHDEIITIGSLDANIIHPREIFKPALEYSAYALILVHNHPTGDPTPSQADLEVSKALLKAGNLLQIPLLDHLIIGENSYISLQKAGHLS